MKILIYAPIFPPVVGGPSIQGFHLCRVLLRNGETPVVVTTGEKFETNSPDGYKVYRYPWKYTNTPLDKIIRGLVFPFFLLKVLRKEKPDIIHCNNVATLSFVVGWFAKIMKISSVVKYGGEWVWETLSALKLRTADLDELYKESLLARILWKIEKKGLSNFDSIWVPSEYRAMSVEKFLGHRDNVHIIKNSMDLPPGGFHELSPDDPYIVVTASRIVPHKRIPLIIEAFKSTNDPKAKLIIIGEGEEMEKSKKAAEDLGVSNQVTFTGKLFGDQVYNEMKKASVYISASLEEGFPNVFVDAMHFGLPIISSNVGGCKEMVIDGENGYLFEPFDTKTLESKLKLLNSDRVLRNKLAKKSYEFSGQYDLNVTIKQFMEMYEDAKRRRANKK